MCDVSDIIELVSISQSFTVRITVVRCGVVWCESHILRSSPSRPLFLGQLDIFYFHFVGLILKVVGCQLLNIQFKLERFIGFFVES